MKNNKIAIKFIIHLLKIERDSIYTRTILYLEILNYLENYYIYEIINLKNYRRFLRILKKYRSNRQIKQQEIDKEIQQKDWEREQLKKALS